MWTNTFRSVFINKDQIHFIITQLSHGKRATWLKFSPLLGNLHISLSLLCYGLYLYCGEKWCTTLIGGLFLHVDDNFLVNKGLSSISLEIGKKNMHIVSSSFLFHGFSWLYPWRNKNSYTLHQVIIVVDWISLCKGC
jgi:hypothetical protein